MRKCEHGINWDWYYADTKEEAEEWFEELTGSKPEYDWLITQFKGKWAFRLHK